ncbi:MAG TPA: phosphate ABC transporter substrate-binding protein PstS [Actinoplanes sp.]|jgi:phosphate transport system substrate-binding protein
MRLLLIAALLLGVAGCDAARPAEASSIACAAGSIAGQGSSAQATAVTAWIKNYQVACSAATIEYTAVGSGAGVTAFAGGKGNFAGSDSALTAATRPQAAARCGGPVLHLPMVVGPIALAYNVAGVDDLRLKPATIARIFAGTITSWNDPAIAADNPGAILPTTPIRTVHRSDSSGTTDNFTKFLTATGGSAWPAATGSTWKAPGGTPAKGSNGVVAAIERTEGAIGYVEASYARFHELPTALVGNAAGQFEALTDEAAGAQVAGAKAVGSGGDLPLALDYGTARPGAYPIVLVTYEIVCAKGAGPLVKSFFSYAVSPAGQAAATRLGYAPLPDALRAKVAAAVAALS